MSVVYDCSPFPQPKSRGSCWFGLIVVLLFLGVLALFTWFVGVKMFFRYQIQKSMDPVQYQEMIRFLDNPVEFPKEWADVPPYSAELQSASRELFEILKNLDYSRIHQISDWSQENLRNLNRGEETNDEITKEMRRVYQENFHIVRAVQNLSEAPDYQIDAFPGNASEEILPEHKVTLLVSRLLCVEGHLLAMEGRWEEAVKSVLSALRLTRRHPASTIVGHLVGMNSQMLGSVTLSTLSRDIENPLLLEEIIKALNALDEQINHHAMEKGMEMDILGLLRLAKRRGADIDLSPGQLGGSYFQQCVLSGGFMAKSVGQATQEDTPAPIMGSVVDITFAVYFSPGNFEDALIREKVSRIIFDLTLLSILNRIRELRGESPAVAATDLSEGNLSTQPVDVFVNRAFLWDASGEQFYSVGPDEKDNLNQLQYSPTNGIRSVGDISLR